MEPAEVTRVRRYIERWGVKLSYVTQRDISNLDVNAGPHYWTFVNWREGRIMYKPDGVFHRDAAHMLLHELAHCLAPVRPPDVDEPRSLMLAFEYHSSRYLKLSGWSQWISDYGLPEDDDAEDIIVIGGDWKDCTQAERSHYLNISRREAVTAGVLTPEYTPTFQRPQWMESV